MGTVSIDFKNGAYAINGVACAVTDVVRQDPDLLLAWDTAYITPGIGVKVDSSLIGDLGLVFPFLTPDAFAALITDGTETVSGTIIAEVYSNAAITGAILEGAGTGVYLLNDDFSEWIYANVAWVASGAAGLGTSDSNVNCSDLVIATAPMASNVPPNHIGYYSMSRAAAELSIDAGGQVSIAKPTPFVATKIAMDIALYGSVVSRPNNQYVILEGIELNSSTTPSGTSDAFIKVGDVIKLPCFSPCIPHAIKVG